MTGAEASVELRRAVVVTALPVEARGRRALGRALRRAACVGACTRGHLDAPAGRWDGMVAIAGRDNEAATEVTGHAVRDFDPAVALVVGVAGGLKDVRHGDVVAADAVSLYQAGKQEADQFLARPQAQRGDERLIDLARHLSLDDAWLPDPDRLTPE